MNKRKIELFKFKTATEDRYDGLYFNYLKEAVRENDYLAEELPGIEAALRVYMDTYKIDGSGFVDGKVDHDSVRMDVVYRCARLMYCVYDKSPARRSKYVSTSRHCVMGSYGLKHVLEYWLGVLSDHTVAKPCESAADSYVRNGEAILACFVLRDQFEDWPCRAVWFNPNKHDSLPNLYNIRFNACFKNFLAREFDRFEDKHFDFGTDTDGNLVACPKFNERNFMAPLYHPSNIWGEHLARLNISRSTKCR